MHVTHVSARGAMTLSFRLGSIPVQIQAWFLVLGLLLGLGPNRGPLVVTARAAAVLAALFSHELARALAARSFGLQSEVSLTFSRGAFDARIASLPRAKRVFVALSGPALNLVSAALVLAVVGAHSATEGLAGTLAYLGWIQLSWGALNLLPILPLDGGNALLAIFDRATCGRGELVARSVSIAAAVMLGCACAAARLHVPALMCAVAVIYNARAMGMTRGARNRDSLASARLNAAHYALERNSATVAAGHCRAVLSDSTNPAQRRDAVRLLAYALATNDEWGQFIALLASHGTYAIEDDDLERYQRAARELGRKEDAWQIGALRDRRQRTDREGPSSALGGTGK